MTELLVKLFSRGNRLSDRMYADRARPEKVVRDAKTADLKPPARVAEVAKKK